MRKLRVFGIVTAVIVLLGLSAVAVIFLDLASYTATGSQTLSPSGTSVGRALVVYDPGLSGAAQKAAQKIAGDLQDRGYTVDLVGIRSSAASGTSGYAVIVAGGPMYFGQATSSVEEFFRSLPVQEQARVGAFVTTGFSLYSPSDFASLQQQLKSATSNQVTAQMILDGSVDQNCSSLAVDLSR
jgi:menaquinone-dependent protoporphyrinogen IX oxidase